MIVKLATCRSIRRTLEAFVDGELPGVLMLRTAGHVESCDACAGELAATREVGELLRDTAKLTPSPAMDGLADGVIARVRAEQTQSWSAILERGMNDWHWAIVGFGAVTATSLVTLFVAAVLAFGPAPGRSDSLAAMLNEPAWEPPQFVEVPGNGDRNRMLTSAANGGSVPRRAMGGGGVVLGIFAIPSEQALVSALSQQLNRQGGLVRLHSMGEEDQLYTEALLHQISLYRMSTSRVELWMSTTVSANGL